MTGWVFAFGIAWAASIGVIVLWVHNATQKQAPTPPTVDPIIDSLIRTSREQFDRQNTTNQELLGIVKMVVDSRTGPVPVDPEPGDDGGPTLDPGWDEPDWTDAFLPDFTATPEPPDIPPANG